MNILAKPLQARLQDFDPILLSVIQNLLVAVMDECEVNPSRTAISPLIYEGKDYCCWPARCRRKHDRAEPGKRSDFMRIWRTNPRLHGMLGQRRPGGRRCLIYNYAEVWGQHLNNVVLIIRSFIKASSRALSRRARIGPTLAARRPARLRPTRPKSSRKGFSFGRSKYTSAVSSAKKSCGSFATIFVSRALTRRHGGTGGRRPTRSKTLSRAHRKVRP